MIEDGAERSRLIIARMTSVLLRHAPDPGIHATKVPGLHLCRHDRADVRYPRIVSPKVAFFVQGSKIFVLGGKEMPVRPAQSLVAGLDLPGEVRVVDARPDRPFLSFFLDLDKDILDELVALMPSEDLPAPAEGAGASVAPVDPDVLDAAARLLELLDRPSQISIRAPLILRELHYLLLVGPQGGLLARIHDDGSKDNRIARLIALLRNNVSLSLRLGELAREAGMSVSTLHRHFKILTGFSPLQYHKRLRLHEARRLMFAEGERAFAAARAVGYESVTQFSREYKRMFGEPPHRDVLRLRRMP